MLDESALNMAHRINMEINEQEMSKKNDQSAIVGGALEMGATHHMYYRRHSL